MRLRSTLLLLLLLVPTPLLPPGTGTPGMSAWEAEDGTSAMLALDDAGSSAVAPDLAPIARAGVLPAPAYSQPSPATGFARAPSRAPPAR